eukprot:1150601-Pelagomonas_calceolata.AAC.2
MDSLSSLHQIRKQILYPEKHRHHVQGDLLKATCQISKADTVAKYQASLKDNNLTYTGIHSAGPGGNPFYNITWLAREEARPTTPELSSPIPNLICLPDLKDALKSHIHDKNGLGYADHKTGYYTYYQSLLPHANKGTSNMPSGTCLERKERAENTNY